MYQSNCFFLLAGLRSSKQETYNEASLMIKNFIHQCTDSDATKRLFSYLISILKGNFYLVVVHINSFDYIYFWPELNISLL